MSLWSALGAGAGTAFGPLGSLAGAYLGSKAGQDPASEWANRPDPYAGMPKAPTDQTGGVSMDHTGLDKFKQEAFRTGPSNWARMATAQQGNNAMAARASGASQVGTQQAQAEDNLASAGGLTSGARERLATSGGRSMLDMGQQVGKQQSDNNLQISMNDEQNRISQLGQVPGMDSTVANFDLGKAQGQNAFNANNYQTQGGIWGAGKQADAEDPRNPASAHYDDKKRWYNPFSW